jgi:hypothetical protein
VFRPLPGAGRLRPVAVRFEDDQPLVRLPQLRDQPAAADAPHHAVAVRHAGLAHEPAGALRPFVGARRLRGGEKVALRLDLVAAEAVDAALARADVQPAATGDDVRRPAVDVRGPRDRGLAFAQRQVNSEHLILAPNVQAVAALGQRLDARQVERAEPHRLPRPLERAVRRAVHRLRRRRRFWEAECRQFGAREGVEPVAAQHGPVAGGAEVIAVDQVEDAGAVEEDAVRSGDGAAAALLRAVGELVVQQLAGAAVVARRHRAAGNQQAVAHNHEAALRRDAGERLGLVRLLHERRAVAVTGPDRVAGLGVHRVQEDAHERPDAGREVHHAVGDGRGAAHRPHRDEALVAEDFAVRRPAAELPQQPAAVQADAVQVAVVRRDVRPVAADRRREPHRAVGRVSPRFLSGFTIVGGDAVGARRGEEHEVAGCDRFRRGVERHQQLVGQVVGRRLARGAGRTAKSDSASPNSAIPEPSSGSPARRRSMGEAVFRQESNQAVGGEGRRRRRKRRRSLNYCTREEIR